MDYAKTVTDEDLLYGLILEFFLGQGRTMVNWLHLYTPESSQRKCVIDPPLEPVASGLYYASYGGLTNIIKGLLEHGVDVNA